MRTRLSTKVIVSLMAALGALLAASQLLSTRATRDVVQDVRRSELDAELGRFRQQLDDLATTREQTAIAAARMGEALYRAHRANPTVDPREGAASIERALLESSPAFVLGVGVYFEPGVFAGADRWIGPYASRGEHGEPVVTWEYATDAYDYPRQSWYTQVVPAEWDRSRRIEAPMRTSEPYVDQLAGQPTVFQSVVHALHDDEGRVIGVASVDSTGATVDELLRSYRPTPSSSAFLVDARGLVLYPRSGDELASRDTLRFGGRIPWDAIPSDGVLSIDGLEADGHTYDLRLVRVGGNAILGAELATDEAYTVLRQVERDMGLYALVTLIAVSIVVFFVVRRLLRPLATVTEAAERVAAGDLSVKVDVPSRDEIGKLARSFTAMVDGVRARDEQLRHHAESLEETVAQRTASIQLLLDSTGDALVPVAPDGTMLPGVSRSAVEWFGAPREGEKIWEFFFGASTDRAIELEMGFEQLVEDLLPYELVAAQMPSRITKNERVYGLQYRRVMKGEKLESILVVAQDITARVVGEQREADFRETQQLVGTLMADRTAFRASIREIESLLGKLESGWVDSAEQRRDLHTIKGSAAILGFTTVPQLCHTIEDRLAEEPELVTSASFHAVRKAWAASLGRIEDFLRDEQRVQIEESEFQGLVARITSNVEHDRLLAFVRSLRDEPTRSQLARLAAQAKRVARQVGKQVEIDIDDHGIRLAPSSLVPLWTSLVHIVRNAVDHGLEFPEEREASGKKGVGQLRVGTEWTLSGMQIVLEDDGRGIDWERVRAKAQKAGLPHAKHEDLVDALFTDGLSTKDEVTDLSGRGVGLSAVRAAVQALHGEIRVESRVGHGTTFEIEIPLEHLGVRRPTYRPSRPPLAA